MFVVPIHLLARCRSATSAYGPDYRLSDGAWQAESCRRKRTPRQPHILASLSGIDFVRHWSVRHESSRSNEFRTGVAFDSIRDLNAARSKACHPAIPPQLQHLMVQSACTWQDAFSCVGEIDRSIQALLANLRRPPPATRPKEWSTPASSTMEARRETVVAEVDEQ